MKIETKTIKRINEAIIKAHLTEDRKAIELLHKKKMQYLKRWLKS